MRKKINVAVELCHPNAKLPKYANDGDAGMDVYTIEDMEIGIRETKIFKTGLKFVIPDGYEIQIRPRSGISFKTPLRISNSPGTIDCSFRDEIGIIITNTSTKSRGVYSIETKGNIEGVYKIPKGSRIAQIVLQEVPYMNFTIVNSVLDVDSSDRGGGFGSTGIK